MNDAAVRPLSWSGASLIDRWLPWPRPAQTQPLELADAAELVGLLAALSAAGLPPARIWPLLAEQPSPSARPAERVARVIGLGGSAADGLRAASTGLTGGGAPALRWLAVCAFVAERTGASSGGVYAGLAHGIHAELEHDGELEAALTGPRTTAMVLGLLPLAGLGLGALIGVNPLNVLFTSAPGRACLIAGGLLWLAGRCWSKRMLASAGHPS